MIQFRKQLPRVALLSLVALTAACSSLGLGKSTSSTGERMVAEGRAMTALGKTWQEGEAKVKKGNKLIAKGREQIDEGETMIREGNALITEGRDMIAQAERDYRQESSGAPASLLPVEPPDPIAGTAGNVDQLEDDVDLPDRTYGDLSEPAGQ